MNQNNNENKKDSEKKVYVTTTLPYVNAALHVGHAMEFVRADTFVRFCRARGDEVFFNTGSDEHGQKIYDSAIAAGTDPLSFCDTVVLKFKETLDLLHISKDRHFIRTTDAHHITSAQHFWNLVLENGYIEKKMYTTKYCIGCELEKTDSELVNGECPHHIGKKIEERAEENYFFLFSKLREQLHSYYESTPLFVKGEGRFNEMKALVESGLQDFSISRLKEKMSWGIPVPNDENHVMYVWFDALTNYINTLGWPEDIANYEKFWVNGDTYQYAGKDNTRQQSAMWQAMLMAAGLSPSKHIRINGFINGANGVKMSKSMGNVIAPSEPIEKYGVDAFRYFVLRHIPSFEDGDLTMDIFHEVYTAHLVNGLGNLASRILTLSEKYCETVSFEEVTLDEEFITCMEGGNFDKAFDSVWKKIGELDEFISRTEPFKVIKIDIEAGKMLIDQSRVKLYEINAYLESAMPETFLKLKQYIQENKKPETPLFPRIEK